MRLRLSWIRWLVIMAVTLSAAGLLGWWYVHEGRDHDQHADHDHAKHAETKNTDSQVKRPERPRLKLITTMPNMEPKNPRRRYRVR